MNKMLFLFSPKVEILFSFWLGLVGSYFYQFYHLSPIYFLSFSSPLIWWIFLRTSKLAKFSWILPLLSSYFKLIIHSSTMEFSYVRIII